MMTITYILAAVVLLGLCIFVHELGHLLGGRMVGIKAKVFSLGYGKGVLSKKVGDTTYQVTLIPFGGYCQFYGEDPSEERDGHDFEFLSAAPWRRIVTVLMGPLFNLFFGVLLFFMMNLVGYTKDTNRIVIPDQMQSGKYVSAAYSAGIRDGDTVVDINGKKVNGFSDIQTGVFFSEGKKLDITVIRDGRRISYSVTPRDYDGSGRYTIGVVPYGNRILVAGLLKGEAAEEAGIRELDEIRSVDGRRFNNPAEFTDYIKGKAGEQVSLEILRAEEEISINAVPKLNEVVVLYAGGADKDRETALFDKRTIEKYTAKNRMLLNGVPYSSYRDFVTVLKGFSGRTVEIEAGGKKYSGRAAIDRRGFLGLYPATAPDKVICRYNVPDAFVRALIEPYEFIALNVRGIGMLFTGKLSVRENLSGPIRIAKIAGDVAYYRGISAFIILMAKISIILMVMNLLPIPAVDGSHLVFYMIEIIRGKPINEKVMERIQTFGVIFLIILGVFIIINDISMLPVIQRLFQ